MDPILKRKGFHQTLETTMEGQSNSEITCDSQSSPLPKLKVLLYRSSYPANTQPSNSLRYSLMPSTAKKHEMEISQPVMACIADLTYKFTEQLARDLELFAQHGGHKTVNPDDVILSAHRNEHLATLLRSFLHELKGKEIQTKRKQKKPSKKEDKGISLEDK